MHQYLAHSADLRALLSCRGPASFRHPGLHCLAAMVISSLSSVTQCKTPYMAMPGLR